MEGRRIGPYEIVEKLGAGGMGEVYRARDLRLGRDVAIKRLRQEAAGDDTRRRALMREARSIARIVHQNVAVLHDVFEEDDELYLVMELVDGESLACRCGEPLPLEMALDLAIRCGEGLAAAHRQGVVHGDVKPDNIVVTRDGQPKLLDFGVARIALTTSELTEAPTIVDLKEIDPGLAGTVPFMAPEVLLGGRVDHRADIYSLGVTLYQMLTGAYPFAAGTPAGVIDRILHDEPVPLTTLNPRVPQVIGRVIDRTLAKTPGDRYPTMAALLEELRSARARLGGVAGAAGRPVSTGPPSRRWLVPAVTALLLAIVGLAAWQAGVLRGPDGDGFQAGDWIIAVLPSPSQEGTADLAGLKAGLAANLTGKLTQMSRSHGLQVIPASAIQQREIGGYAAARQELGVTLAIDFQLRQIGDRLRAHVNLIDTRQERQIDAATVDGSVDDPIELEEQVALQALRMMRLELQPRDQGLLRAGTDLPRAHGYYLRATGYLQEYDRPESVDAAIDLLEQALQLDPAYSRAHAALGEAFWNRYRLTEEPAWVDRAERECQAAIAAAPEDGAGYRCLGTVYEGTGRAAEAAEALERAKRLDPTDDATYIALANAYLSLGRLDRAEATYEEAISLRPHYWSGYSWLGVFHLRHGHFAEAVENFEQVVSLAPDSYRGYSNLGVAYYYLEDWSRAREAFERALELKPDFHSAVSNLATVLFYEGSYARSAEMYERAVAEAENSYLMWGNLAEAYYWADGLRAKSTEAYRRAIDLATEQLQVNPNDAAANSQVARYFAMLGDEGLAQTHLQRALDSAPTDIDVLHAGAQVHAIIGDRDRAFELLGQAVEAGYPLGEIAADPTFRDLREDQRYQSISAR